MKAFLLLITALVFTTVANAYPTLYFTDQFGNKVNAYVTGGTANFSANIAANSILSNLTGSSAAPVANTYAAVSAKLTPAILLTGFSSGAGTVASTDTVLQGFNKLSGNTQNLPVISNLLTGYSAGAGTCSASDSIKGCLQKLGGNVAAHQANSTAADVAALVVDFNALLAKLQAANLMAP